jgi:hypothetical protein
MLSKPINDARVVVGCAASGPWAVEEMTEGGPKSALSQACRYLDIAVD